MVLLVDAAGSRPVGLTSPRTSAAVALPGDPETDRAKDCHRGDRDDGECARFQFRNHLPDDRWAWCDASEHLVLFEVESGVGHREGRLPMPDAAWLSPNVANWCLPRAVSGA